MDDDSYRFEKFCFRIIGVSEDVVASARAILDNSLIKVGHYFKDESIKIMAVELKEDTDYSKFIELVKNSAIDRKQCGLFSSLVTARDTSGIAVPDFVVEIFMEIGYQLDFSFTVI